MNINILQWRYSPLLMLMALWLPIDNAQAAVNCTASMPTVNLGNVTPANAGNANIPATLNYKCDNTYVNSRRVYVCLGVDGGNYSPTTVLPRYMSTGSSTPRLAFIMTLPGDTLWTTRRNLNRGSEYKSVLHDIPGGGSIDINVPINISLLPSNGNALATPGIYTNKFDGGHTAITTDVSPLNGDGSELDCTQGSQGKGRFIFEVKATVIKDCKVTTTSDVNLGSKPATATNITGNTVIGVTCTNTTPYTISLTPSNNAKNGAGIMSGSTGNLDKIPYNLRIAPGGTSWGNISSNWVTNTGNATNKTKTVYVDVPSADFKPDTYSDTVTIKVDY